MDTRTKSASIIKQSWTSPSQPSCFLTLYLSAWPLMVSNICHSHIKNSQELTIVYVIKLKLFKTTAIILPDLPPNCLCCRLLTTTDMHPVLWGQWASGPSSQRSPWPSLDLCVSAHLGFIPHHLYLLTSFSSFKALLLLHPSSISPQRMRSL